MNQSYTQIHLKRRYQSACSVRVLQKHICDNSVWCSPVFLRKVPPLVVQAAVNVTLQVIRAVKLVALPKHCQILGDGSGSMTVLSALAVAAKARQSDLHDIDGRKQRCLGMSTDSFVFICCPMWLRLCFSLFLTLRFCHISSDLMPLSLLQVQLLESLNWVNRRKSGLKKRVKETEGQKSKVHWWTWKKRRRGKWGEKRFRSPGLWMNAIDRWVKVTGEL